jgi:hypothetical protein
MVEQRLFMSLAACVVACAATTGVLAGSRTYVSLVAVDAAHRPGIPAIVIQVSAPAAEEAEAVRGAIARDLAKLVYTRSLSEGEREDYALRVTLRPRQEAGATITIPFEADLDAVDGTSVWRVQGRTEVDGAPVAADLAAIGRNLVSALAHDGLVQPRYDVNDPPPAAPSVRRD